MTSITYQAVIFDMDGLLLDTERQYMRAMQRCALELGFELEDSILIELIGHSGREANRRMQEAMGPSFPFQDFRQQWPSTWETMVESEGIDTKPGVLEMLELTRKHDLPYAIATSSNQRHAERSLRIAGLAEHFEVRVTGDQIDNGKPAPDIYLEAARRLGVEPARCLALEDSEVGLSAAVSAGMTAFMVPDVKPATPSAASKAHSVLESLHHAAQVIDQMLQGNRR